jgi:type II secretory pathway pseudopilin PulG
MIRASGTSRRGGISLVELLVVVAIIGLLAVTVLPNIANNAESRRSREAARVVSSFVSAAKSRAIGRREWAGFTLVAAAAGSSGAIDMFYSDVPPPYRGDTVNAVLTCGGGLSHTRSATPVGGALDFVDRVGIQAGDHIRFGGRAPFFEVASPPTAAGLSFRLFGHEAGNAPEDLGYVRRNTPWPAVGPSEHSFEIFRRPEISGSPLTLSDGRAIDLRWSGVGPPRVPTTGGTYRQFNASPVSIMFDGTGRIRQAVLPTQRWVITGAVFLLAGRADRAGQDPATLVAADDSVGANWQYADSFWIAIDPFSGVAKVAESVPNPGGATTYERLIASQRWIREAMASDGR